MASIDISAELTRLDPRLRERLARGGFDEQRLLVWSREGASGKEATNRLPAVAPPLAVDIATPPAAGTTEHARLRALGEAALHRGEVAMVVLAGGMATRMGGVVKALVEPLPGRSFLELRVAGHASVERSYDARFPLWLMTSEATEGEIRGALGPRLDDEWLTTFPQNVSLRLTPEGDLFHDETGAPSVYPTGHGDVPDALGRSGLLRRFRDRGGKYLWIANLDNLGATIDPVLLGEHIDGGTALSVEVVEKAGDRGGIPVRVGGRAVVCEDYRLPRDFDASRVDVFNTNTFIADASAIDGYDAPFTYCVVEKRVGDRTAIQRERLIGELTFHLATRFLEVPRRGTASRFLPVKDHDELARRAADLEAVARDRGMLA